MPKLLDYLNTLDRDAAAREAHRKDPETAMEKFGLKDEEQDAVMFSDKKKVATLLGINEDSLPSIEVTHDTYDPSGWRPFGNVRHSNMQQQT